MKRSVFTSLWLLGFCVSVAGETIVVDLSGDEDYSEIQPAIDVAEDGDEVLVKPGEYVITEPVNFFGKPITVRAEGGAEQTIIRVSGSPLDPTRASAVIFEFGETESSVLQGFTLTGGRGSNFSGFSANTCRITSTTSSWIDSFAGVRSCCDRPSRCRPSRRKRSCRCPQIPRTLGCYADSLLQRPSMRPPPVTNRFRRDSLRRSPGSPLTRRSSRSSSC